ncbi:MAG: AMP-binding protein [bacterium]
MGLSETFVRYIGHPLWLCYQGERTQPRFRRRFEALWGASRDQLDNVRLTALQALLRHAGSTSPYYQRLFAEHDFKPEALTDFSDLFRLPPITKQILNGSMSQVLSTRYRREELRQSSTGGSSGITLEFYRDSRATIVRHAQDYFFNSLLGIHPGSRRAWVWGSEMDAFSLRSLKARLSNFVTERAIYFYSFDPTPERMRDFLRQLADHRPQIMTGYPNMLVALAEFALAEQIAAPAIPTVVTTAEPLYEFGRQKLKKAFGAEVINRFGMRELGTVASQISEAGGLHLFEPSYYFELLDLNGEPVAPGELGELVITDFFNYAMPLIRYRTGDMARLGREETSGKTCWRQLTEVAGRVVDMLLRPDGSLLPGEAVLMALRMTGIRCKLQVVQTEPGFLRIKHLRDQEIEPAKQAELRKRLTDLFHAEVSLEFVAHENLDYDKSGKYRYVTSECR